MDTLNKGIICILHLLSKRWQLLSTRWQKWPVLPVTINHNMLFTINQRSVLLSIYRKLNSPDFQRKKYSWCTRETSNLHIILTAVWTPISITKLTWRLELMVTVYSCCRWLCHLWFFSCGSKSQTSKCYAHHPAISRRRRCFFHSSAMWYIHSGTLSYSTLYRNDMPTWRGEPFLTVAMCGAQCFWSAIESGPTDS